ncbi:MAG: hypothetical protein ACI9R3_001621 [Verrucomicrobiales bacterium]|jgi:hypothetical protein
MTSLKFIVLHTRFLLVVVGCVFLFGCVGAQLTHLDPSFTPTALKEGTLAIGGVTQINTAEELTTRQKASIVDRFEREMKSRRPEVPILSHAEVSTALGDTLLSKATVSASIGESIPPEQLAGLAAKGARYVVYIVITFNSVDRFVTNNTDSRNTYDAEGEVSGRRVKYVTIAQTKRSVTAKYRIFDVSTGQRVWASESSNARSRSRTADSRVGYPKAPEYGATPTVSRVLQSMTTAAVKELPAPQKSSATPVPVEPSAE